MKFKRCKKCAEEIHTTHDGLEIDHLALCPENPLTKQVEILYDDKSGRFLVHRTDDPLKPYHPITQGAMIDLQKHLRRYEEDWLKENNKLE
jgi:hypothetical protein